MTKPNYSSIKEISCTTAAASEHSQLSCSRARSGSSWSPSEILECQQEAGHWHTVPQDVWQLCPPTVALWVPQDLCPAPWDSSQGHPQSASSPELFLGVLSFKLRHLLQLSSWGFPRLCTRRPWLHLTWTPLQSPTFLTLLAFWFLFHVESSQLTTDHLIFSTQDQRVTGKKKLGWNKVRATGIEFQKTRISKQFVGICGGQKKATQRKSKRGNFPPRDPPSEGHTLLRLSEFTSGWKRCVQGSTGERVKNKQLECGTSKIFRLLSLFLFWQDVT